jgi:NAD(P)H-hydrate epimerase
VAVRAEVTVTMGALKRGLLLYPGREFAGRILFAEVGFPEMCGDDADAEVMTDAEAFARLPKIAPDAHKGSVGLVAVVAGRKGYGGAAVMTAMGALRAGAGGVAVHSVEENRVILNTAVPEAIFVERSGEGIDCALSRPRVAIIGPAIGTDDEARRVLRGFLAEGLPAGGTLQSPGAPPQIRGFVLDADALTLIAQEPGLLPPDLAGRCVMTPHPGELARLLGVSTEAVLGDRFASAREAAERYGCVVLAKGAPSLIAAPGERTVVNLTGHSGVATAGMGDTLAGIVGAFLATGASPRDAAALGVHFAGRAAEAAGRGRGLLPRDVAEALPGVLFGPGAPAPLPPPFLWSLAEPR